MIDEKKIEAAIEEIYEDRFLLNGEEVVFDNDAKEEMFYKEDIKEAIGLGAKWAINEFLKDLLHPNTEEPDKNKGDIITLVLITMLIHNLKNSFFGIRNLGDIRLADTKLSSGLIYLTYYQKILLIINLIKRNSVW